MTNKINDHIVKLRRKIGKNFIAFRWQYFKHYNKVPDAEFHTDLCTLLQTILHKRGVKLAIAAPRESAKSTIVTLQYIIYCICYQLEDYIVIISSTSSQASALLSNVKRELETNEHLKRDFPEVCELSKKPKPSRWAKDNIITKNLIEVLALGTGQNIRGRRNRQSRPSLIILDDIETDEDAQNPETYQKTYDWLTKSALKAGSSETNVVFIGTIHHYNSLLAQFTSPNHHPGWEKQVYRSVISWSEHPELWQTWIKIFNNQEDFEGSSGPESARDFFDLNQEDMEMGTKVLWPQSKSYYDLMVLREEDGYASFDSEMQNDPVDPSRCLFNLKELHYWDERFVDEKELLDFLSYHAEFYGACDPSMGKRSRHSDNSAIIIAVRDKRDGTIYILVADIAKRAPDKMLDSIEAYHGSHKFTKFGIETNNFQELLAKELKERTNRRGDYLPIEELKNTTDKRARIEAIQPFLKNGTVKLCSRHYALLEEMRYFPKGRHDDGLDALEMVVRLCQMHSGGGVFFSATEDFDVFPTGRHYSSGGSMAVLPELTKHRHVYD